MKLWIVFVASMVMCAGAFGEGVPDGGVLVLDGVKHVGLDCPALRITGRPITFQTWLKTESGGVVFVVEVVRARVQEEGAAPVVEGTRAQAQEAGLEMEMVTEEHYVAWGKGML